MRIRCLGAGLAALVAMGAPVGGCADDRPASIAILPDSAVVMVGDVVEFAVVGRNSTGGITSVGGSVTWSADPSDAVAVSVTGIVQALRVAGAVITASSGGKTAAAKLSIVPTGTYTMVTADGQSVPDTVENAPCPPGSNLTTGPLVVGGGSLKFEIAATSKPVLEARNYSSQRCGGPGGGAGDWVSAVAFFAKEYRLSRYEMAVTDVPNASNIVVSGDSIMMRWSLSNTAYSYAAVFRRTSGP